MVKDELRDKYNKNKRKPPGQFSGPHTPVLDLYQNSTLLREYNDVIKTPYIYKLKQIIFYPNDGHSYAISPRNCCFKH